MDDLAFDDFQARAAAAERMLAELTIKHSASNSPADLSALQELKKIRVQLLASKQQYEMQEVQLKLVTLEKEKLLYQTEHLKRAVREADAKLLNQNGKRPNTF